MESLVSEIRAEIQKLGDPGEAEKSKRFFKEEIETLGLSASKVDAVANRFYPRVKGDLSLAISVAAELMSSSVLDEASVGIRIMKRVVHLFTPKLFDVFDSWVHHLTNWANTDGLATWLIAETIVLDPSLVERLLEWTISENRWRRRAAAVSLVPIARRGEMLDAVFSVANRLMEDGDDMVQKGVGWLLKEASKEHSGEVRDYLLRWRKKTSALVLRYASEKLPNGMCVLKTKLA